MADTRRASRLSHARRSRFVYSISVRLPWSCTRYYVTAGYRANIVISSLFYCVCVYMFFPFISINVLFII